MLVSSKIQLKPFDINMITPEEEPDQSVLISAFTLPIEEKAFVFAHFTRQNTFFFKKKKTLKINAPNSFFENESNFFYIISDFFNKFLKT